MGPNTAVYSILDLDSLALGSLELLLLNNLIYIKVLILNYKVFCLLFIGDVRDTFLPKKG